MLWATRSKLVVTPQGRNRCAVVAAAANGALVHEINPTGLEVSSMILKSMILSAASRKCPTVTIHSCVTGTLDGCSVCF